MFSDPIFWGPKFSRTEISWTPNCRTKNFLDQNSLGSNFFESTVCITKQLFWDKKSFWIKIFLSNFLGQRRSETETAKTIYFKSIHDSCFKAFSGLLKTPSRLLKDYLKYNQRLLQDNVKIT